MRAQKHILLKTGKERDSGNKNGTANLNVASAKTNANPQERNESAKALSHPKHPAAKNAASAARRYGNMGV